MKTNRWTAPLMALILIATFLLGAMLTSTSRANPLDHQICYSVADHDDGHDLDSLSIVDFHLRTETVVGQTNTRYIEAVAYHPPSSQLYAANRDQLGILNTTTAQFTPTSQKFGTGSGEYGEIAIQDVDSLTFDAQTGILWGSNRLGEGRDVYDVFIQIDLVTGAIVQNAFGAGVDYVVARPVVEDGDFVDIDDLAIDPLTRVMYASANDAGARNHLVIVDRVTGIITDLGRTGVNDIEGLAFDTSGELIGTSGKDSGRNSNQLWEIDKDTARAIVETGFPLQEFDYEGVDCLTSWDITTRTPTPSGTIDLTRTPATFTATPTGTPAAETLTPSPTLTPTDTGGGVTQTPTPTATGTPPPDAVTLTYFRISRVDGMHVTLTWKTEMEVNNLGFLVYRAPANDFSQAVPTGDFVAGRGGDVYFLTDTLTEEGIWWYWLMELDTRGHTTRYGPESTGVPASARFDNFNYLPFTTK
jgi:hypothetical protein